MKEFLTTAPSVHVKQSIFEKHFSDFTQIYSPNINASFVTFWAKIGQKSEPQWVLKNSWWFDFYAIFATKAVN